MIKDISKKFVGKFWGPEEIIEVKDTGTTTYRDVMILEVVTKRQSDEEQTRTRTTTLLALQLVATDEAKDWNYAQDIKLNEVTRGALDLATDYGVDGGELQALLSKLGLSLAVRFEHAAHLRFEGNDEEYVPGGNEFGTWSLAKAEHIISTSKKTDETTE